VDTGKVRDMFGGIGRFKGGIHLVLNWYFKVYNGRSAVIDFCCNYRYLKKISRV